MSIIELSEKRFIRCILENGFLYDESHQGYTRVWETNTPDGKLQCLEVYKKDEDVWKQIMYGSDGGVFLLKILTLMNTYHDNLYIR